MVPANSHVGDHPAIRPRTWLLVAIIALGAAAIYAGVRMGDPVGAPGFRGTCERLARAGVTMGPQDRLCGGDASRERMLFLLASVAAGVGLAWPPVVLAATGRRLTAFLPLLPVAGGVTVSVATVSLWNGPPRISDGLAAATIDLVLVATPAAAVAYAMRRRPRPRGPELGWLGCLISAGVCAAAAAAILVAVPVVQAWHYGYSDPLNGDLSTLVPAALVMGIFGALLGSERPWWPWSLVPAALFLSLGPSVALLSTSGYPGVSIWSPFGAVVPLFLVGIAATWWRPMSVAVSRWLERSEASDFDDLPEPAREEAPPGPDARRPFRPAVIPHAVAAGVLAVSVVIFVGDPYPIALAEALPTYAGLRTAAQDLRLKMDLRRAMTAVDLDEQGNAGPFDAAAGELAVPALAWAPPPMSDRKIQAFPDLTMAVTASPHGSERIAAFSESGRAYCIQRSASGTLTYGWGDRPKTGLPAGGAWHEAVASCGDRPWTSATLAPLPIEEMCDGVSVGYLICRTVQGMVAETLHSPAGAP
jgi:hypothetical protein